MPIGYQVLPPESPGTAKGKFGPAADAARVLEELKGVRVIVRIGRDKTAGNASALLALAAADLVMAPGARLGFLDDKTAGETVEVEDTPSVRGMIHAVKHLVEIVEEGK